MPLIYLSGILILYDMALSSLQTSMLHIMSLKTLLLTHATILLTKRFYSSSKLYFYLTTSEVNNGRPYYTRILNPVQAIINTVSSKVVVAIFYHFH